jgi:hypothetical protein
MNVIVEDLQTVYSDNMHNMNPSIASWKGKYYVVFRSSLSHATPADFEWEGYQGGNIKITSSTDLVNWSPPVTIIDTDRDDRDPKLLITDDRLFVYEATIDEAISGTSGIIFRERTMMVYTEDGINWSEPTAACATGHAFWGLHKTAHKGVCYVAADIDDDPVERPVAERGRVDLLRSTDGFTWEMVSTICSGSCCTESPLAFLEDDTMIVFTRVDHLGVTWLSRAKPPYTRWERFEALHVGGASAARVGDRVLVAGRQGGGQTTLLQLYAEDPIGLFVLRTMPVHRWGPIGDKANTDFWVLNDHRFLLTWYEGEPYEHGVPKEADIRLATVTICR